MSVSSTVATMPGASEIITSLLEAANVWLEAPCPSQSDCHRGKTCITLQVVHVCAEHKKPQKLLKHLASIKEQSAGMRNPPR